MMAGSTARRLSLRKKSVNVESHQGEDDVQGLGWKRGSVKGEGRV